MGAVMMHAVVSVDGFIADADDEVGPLFDWYFNGEEEIVDGGPFKVSRESSSWSRTVRSRTSGTPRRPAVSPTTSPWRSPRPRSSPATVTSR
jgi:hypothetical protein